MNPFIPSNVTPKTSKSLRLWIAILALSVFAAGYSRPVPTARAANAGPKLVVIFAVDQMRGDYLDRFASEWRGGLKRFIDQGAWFTNAAYPYSGTVTCAGHSSISTGDFPDKHGMISNNWWDRELNKEVNCTEDPSTHLLSYDGAALAITQGDSPWRLKAPAFADSFRAAYPNSHIVTLSDKARAAVPLGGHDPDSVTWLEGSHWVTSDFYGHEPSKIIAQYVTSHPITEDAGKTWSSSFSSNPSGKEAANFSYTIGSTGSADSEFISKWTASPYSDAYLGSMAAAAVSGMHLGQNSTPDFLAIGFSAVDLVGHHYGPDSPEIHDLLLHLDDTLGKLLAALDISVGKGNYVVALTADHGVAQIPEDAVKEGKPAGRLDSPEVSAQIEKALKEHGYPDKSVLLFDDGNIYLKIDVRDKLKNDPTTIQAVLSAARGVEGIADAFWGEQIKDLASKNHLARAASFSYYPGRSGDIVVITKPYWIFDRRGKLGKFGTGTTHGTPYPYDQHVPVVLMGAGIKAGKFDTDSSPADVIPTLAAIAHVKLPPTEGKPLTSALSSSRH
jgi:predicted AlkP superfamily pyrophosphatase or phosphodiesterase